MADEDFPIFLGIPTADSYGYQDQDVEIVTTYMESGNIRRRQRSKNIPTNFILRFIFDELQLGVFEYFNQYIIESLTLRFNISLKTGQGTGVYDVKYAEAPKVMKIGALFKVTCNIETNSRTHIDTDLFLPQFLAHDLP